MDITVHYKDCMFNLSVAFFQSLFEDYENINWYDLETNDLIFDRNGRAMFELLCYDTNITTLGLVEEYARIFMNKLIKFNY